MGNEPRRPAEKESLPRRPEIPRLGLVLLAGISLFWGINWPVVKVALAEIRPWTFRTFCLFFSGLGLLALARIKIPRLAIPRGDLTPLLVSALLNVLIWQVLSAYALLYLGAGPAVIIAFTMPVWAAFMAALFLGERLTWRIISGLALGLAGLVILVGGGFQDMGMSPLGAFFMLLCALSWAGGTIVVKKHKWALPTAAMTGWTLFLGGLPVIAGALILEPAGHLLQVSWKAYLATAYVILLPMLFCHWAWFKIVDLLPASLASLSTLLVPVIGVISSALALGEPLGAREIVSLSLVLAALALVMIRR